MYCEDTRSSSLAKLDERGVRFRAEALYKELNLLLKLRPMAKAALVAEARKDPAWPRLRTIPFLGPGAGRVDSGDDADAVAVSQQGL